MSIVYYSKRLSKRFLEKLRKELRKKFGDAKNIAIKIHFGEPGNRFALTPAQVKPITDMLKELNYNYFLFDSCVAYLSPRMWVKSHLRIAKKKGWNKLGKLIVSQKSVKVKSKHLTYRICKHLLDADAVLVISHVKGHYCSGFGGAIKNIGMGAVTRWTKAKIHFYGMPKFKGRCVQCLKCQKSCPINGIIVKKKPRFVKCNGCSNCTKVCPLSSIKPRKTYFDTLLAESAYTAQSNFKNYFYVSYLTNITKECDCEKNPKKKIAKNCGYIFGDDIVAIDKAAYDIINKNNGDVFLKHNKKTGLEQIKAAEKYKMGSSRYVLRNV